MSNKNKYSWKTSLPAYLENMKGKDKQERLILYIMRRCKGKKSTLKEIQHLLKYNLSILIAQSTISARMSDLRHKRKVYDTGIATVYDGRLRKVFKVIPGGGKIPKAKIPKMVRQEVKPMMLTKEGRLYILRLSNGTIYYSTTGKGWKRNNPLKKTRKPGGKPFLHSLTKKKK